MTQEVMYVEIDVDFCSLTYGTSPCTAVVGTQEEIDAETATGLIKCYNTLKTCQDRANFTNAPVTLRFCKDVPWRDKSIEAIPNLLSVDFTPAMISLGSDLGQRASVKSRHRDHSSDDTMVGLDPYFGERSGNPSKMGTFWGKTRARQPYLRAREYRYITGTADQALADMETRTFVIEGFQGPGRDGVYTLVAKDDLKRADGDRAVMPSVSTGKLSGAITSGATSATLASSGVGDLEYPTSGVLNIGGKELVAFTRSMGSDILTLTRAQYNTTAVAHDAGERCQLCKVYTAADPADVMSDLFENGAGIDSAQIPLTAWQDETTAYYGRVVTTLIPEPTPVKTLAAELIEQCGLAVWWDDLTPQVRLQVLRPVSTDAEVFSALPGGNILKGSFQVTEQPDKRLTHVEVYFGQINPLKGVEDPDNFRSVEVTIDTDAEADDGKSRQRIYSRWTPFGGNTAAIRVGEIKVERFKNGPRKFKFEVMRHGDASPTMGEGCLIEAPNLQDATGATVQVPAQITRVTPGAGKYTVEAEELTYGVIVPLDPNDRPITIDSDINDADLPTLHTSLYGAPLAGSIVDLTIDSGVIVGSTSTSTPALNIGDTTYWPTEAATGNTTLDSAVVTGLSIDAVALLAVGEVVTGTGIAAGSRILTIDSTSQVTLDTNATANGTGVALTIYTVQIIVNDNGKVRGHGGTGGNGGVGDENQGTVGLAGGTALKTRYPTILNMAGDIKGGGAGGGGGDAHYNWPWGPQYNGRAGGGGAGRVAGTGGTSAAGAGNAGSLEAGGAGLNRGDGGVSGVGGVPGATGGSASPGKTGGTSGAAVDGWSKIIEDTITGTYAGGQVN